MKWVSLILIVKQKLTILLVIEIMLYDKFANFYVTYDYLSKENILLVVLKEKFLSAQPTQTWLWSSSISGIKWMNTMSSNPVIVESSHPDANSFEFCSVNHRSSRKE